MTKIFSNNRDLWSSLQYVCWLGGYGGLSESGLCVLCELCPVSFLVVGESLLVLL